MQCGADTGKHDTRSAVKEWRSSAEIQKRKAQGPALEPLTVSIVTVVQQGSSARVNAPSHGPAETRRKDASEATATGQSRVSRYTSHWS